MPRAKKLSPSQYGQGRRATRVTLVEKRQGGRIREVVVPVPLTQTVPSTPSTRYPSSLHSSPTKSILQMLDQQMDSIDFGEDLFTSKSKRKSGKV